MTQSLIRFEAGQLVSDAKSQNIMLSNSLHYVQLCNNIAVMTACMYLEQLYMIYNLVINIALTGTPTASQSLHCTVHNIILTPCMH